MTNAAEKVVVVHRVFSGAATKIVLLFVALLISQAAIAQTVYITRTGEKYHEDACRYLSRSKIKTSLPEAQKNGYTACSVCKPAGKALTNKQRLTTTPTITRPKSTASLQCSATTKANKRCSRMTTDSSGKCWQHQ